MPQYHNNILCVTTSELELCGVSAGYLKRALAGQRKGEVYCWEHHKDGKRVLIHYHSLKDNYKASIRETLCNGTEPDLFLKQQDGEKAQATLSELTDSITGLVTTDPNEIKVLMETKLYTPTEAHQLARAAGWLRLINEVDVKKARKIGFNSIVEFRNEVFKRCLNEQKPSYQSKIALIKFKKGTINNERVLYRNAVEYKEQGIKCLIHAGVGNVNREKGDTQSHAMLIMLASNPVKYNFEDIAMMYNDWAEKEGKQNLTTSAIKHYLNTPKIKRIWYYARHGKLAADNEMQQLINRDKPSFPDALWSVDGTTMQLYYRDATGKILSDLYVYFVTDAHTGAIIGHSAAYAETAGMVSEALCNAINRYENKPYQLQYDNSAANKAFITQSLMTNMTRVHFGCEPYKGRSKYVESIIGHFQQQVLRKRENFKGGNVTVKSLNSVANPELLNKLRKNADEQLPTMEEVIDEFNKAVEEWNTRGERRDSYGRWVGDSKISKYINTAHEKREKLNYFDKISLFMVEQRDDYTYTTEGIRLEIDGKKLKFIVPDPDSVGDFIFANENLGRKFRVKVNPEKPELITLWVDGKNVATAYEKERYAACVADLKDGEKAKQVLFKAKQEEYGQQYSLRELEKQMSILGELKATGTDGFGWWDSSKTAENNRQNRQEDVRNGMSDGLTELERKLLTIG